MTAVDPMLVEKISRRVVQLRTTISEITSRPVEIVAVSKGRGAGEIASALECGLTLFGENYADELCQKAAQLSGSGARWTFQGRLQTNKIKRLEPFVELWQTADSAERIKTLAQRSPGAQILVQINLSSAPNRPGVGFGDVEMLVELGRGLGLKVQGLMGVGPEIGLGGPAELISLFRRAVDLADRMQLPVRSLGMSGDYKYAIQAGSNMIRVGQLLFG